MYTQQQYAAIIQSLLDPLVYPPLDRRADVFEPHLSFAQALRNHIEFCVAEEPFSEDPTVLVIY